MRIGIGRRSLPLVLGRWSTFVLRQVSGGRRTNDERPTTNDQRHFHHREARNLRQTSRPRAVCYNFSFFNSLGEFLYRHLERRLAQHVREFLRRTYDLDLAKIVIEQPPKVEFGEYALPLAFRTGQEAAQGAAQDCGRDRQRNRPHPRIRETGIGGRGLHQRAGQARRACRQP